MGHAAPEKTVAEGGIMRGKIEIRPVDDVKKGEALNAQERND
jgi:hypothetical protein